MQSEPTSGLARAGLVVAGKFRLDALIGQGGMGSVWSATHLGLGHQIAIKLVSREFVRSPGALRRFDAEAKAVARLQSRHVVQVYDNGTLDDGTPYIAMELLTGETLQQRVDRVGALSMRETVNILGQCCKALGRAHGIGIIHRDIKPDNIFLSRSPDEDGEVAKILDFGVAKVALGEGTDGDQSMTKTGAVLGTPLYMSPEQARGLKSIDHRTDLYSLGLVTYTMLTGRDAFEGESFGDILIKICVEPLPRLSPSANVPITMGPWFEHACARDPAHRCASAQEFVETLRLASGLGAATSPPSSELRHEPGRVAVTLTDASFPPLRLATSTPSVADANVSLTAAGVPRRRGGVVVLGIVGALVMVGGAAFFVLAGHHGTMTLDPARAPASVEAPPPALPSATLAPREPDPLPSAPAASAASAAPAESHAAVPVSVPTAPPPARSVPIAPPHPAAAGTAGVHPNPTKTPSTPAKIDLGY